MTIENGAAPAANDTVTPAATSSAPAEANAPKIIEDDAPQGREWADTPDTADDGAHVADAAPEFAEVEIDGKKYKVQADAKDFLLRQADYTQKTQALAEQRKTLEADRQAIATASQEVMAERVKAHTLAATVKQYDEYFATPDWANLKVQDPITAAQHYQQYQEMKADRDKAQSAIAHKERELAGNKQREIATRADEVRAELPKIIPDWSQELDVKLGTYGTANKLSPQDMADATLRNPNFVAILNKARLYDEAQATTAMVKEIEAVQQVKPATQVRANASTATKDPDKMTDAQYRAWRSNGGGERKSG